MSPRSPPLHAKASWSHLERSPTILPSYAGASRCCCYLRGPVARRSLAARPRGAHVLHRRRRRAAQAVRMSVAVGS
eukprot:11198450-Lingulodinium_polyedra.AAC.1